MSDLVWTVVVALVMVVGLVGVVVPILPGLILIWLAALGYGFAVGFGWVGLVVMVALTGLVVVSVVKGVVIPKRAADGAGASGWSQLGGLVGAVIGLFTIPVVGVFVGALAGVLVVELATKGNWPDARRATVGLAKGFGISALIDLGLGSVMIASWSLWALTVLV